MSGGAAPDGTVRVGLIGAGVYAHREHIPGLLACPAARVTAVCDWDGVRRDEVAGLFGAPESGRFREAGDLFAARVVDAVVVSVPNVFHHPMVRAALQAGLHVLVDKPFTLSTSDARDLRDFAVACGRVLMVAYNRHFDPGSLWLRAQIQSGAAGDVRLIRTVQRNFTDRGWLDDPAMAGGRMLTTRVTHMADLVRWLKGEEIVSISATVRWHDREMLRDADSITTLTFASGALGELVALEEIADHDIDEVWVYGTGATYRLARLPEFGNTWHPFTVAPGGVQRRVTDLPPGGQVTRAFVDVVRGVAENTCTAVDGVAAVRAVEAIFEAGRTGKRVELWPNGGPDV